MRSSRSRRVKVAVQDRDESGLGIVEVMVASLILIIVAISIGNMVIDSLSAALISRQREAAASIASNVVENAKGLGQAALVAETASTTPCPASTQPVRVITSLNEASFDQCFTTTVDRTVYTVSPTVAVGTPDVVTVKVAWNATSYSTSTDLGQ